MAERLVKITLRIPESASRKLKRDAEKSGRTSAEIGRDSLLAGIGATKPSEKPAYFQELETEVQALRDAFARVESHIKTMSEFDRQVSIFAGEKLRGIEDALVGAAKESAAHIVSSIQATIVQAAATGAGQALNKTLKEIAEQRGSRK